MRTERSRKLHVAVAIAIEKGWIPAGRKGWKRGRAGIMRQLAGLYGVSRQRVHQVMHEELARRASEAA